MNTRQKNSEDESINKKITQTLKDFSHSQAGHAMTHSATHYVSTHHQQITNSLMQILSKIFFGR